MHTCNMQYNTLNGLTNTFLFGTENDVTKRRRSSRPKEQVDAKYMDLPDLFDDYAILERNRRVVEVI